MSAERSIGESIHPHPRRVEARYGGTDIPAFDRLPLEKYITQLNELDPGARMIVTPNKPDSEKLMHLYGTLIYPPVALFTDGIFLPDERFCSVTPDASYVAWVATEQRIPPSRGDSLLTSFDGHSGYHLMSKLRMGDIRKIFNAVPNNTIELVYSKGSYSSNS